MPVPVTNIKAPVPTFLYPKDGSPGVIKTIVPGTTPEGYSRTPVNMPGPVSEDDPRLETALEQIADLKDSAADMDKAFDAQAKDLEAANARVLELEGEVKQLTEDLAKATAPAPAATKKKAAST